MKKITVVLLSFFSVNVFAGSDPMLEYKKCIMEETPIPHDCSSSYLFFNKGGNDSSCRKTIYFEVCVQSYSNAWGWWAKRFCKGLVLGRGRSVEIKFTDMRPGQNFRDYYCQPWVEYAEVMK